MFSIIKKYFKNGDLIAPDSAIAADDFLIVAIAGENLTANDAVYIDPSDEKAYKCDADDVTKIGFKGFVQATVLAAANVRILPAGVKDGFSSLTVGATYYLSGTAGGITATRPTNYKIVGTAVTDTMIKIAAYPTRRKRILTANTPVGDRTTQFDITNTAGNTYRYTFDGTGTDPSISSGTFPTGTVVDIQGANFASANKGMFVVTGSGANYFEVTNASGTAESNKTLGVGYINKGGVWIKPNGLLWIEIEGQAGGAGGESGNTSGSRSGGGGGSAGGYGVKKIFAEDLGATENYVVGYFGLGGVYNSGQVLGYSGGRTVFGAHLVLNGGVSGENTAGGTATGGDLNIQGGSARPKPSGFLGSTGSSDQAAGDGADSQLGRGGMSPWLGGAGDPARGYGAGGSGGSKGQQTGGDGSIGIMTIIEVG